MLSRSSPEQRLSNHSFPINGHRAH
jgi:hypothetical protein